MNMPVNVKKVKSGLKVRVKKTISSADVALNTNILRQSSAAQSSNVTAATELNKIISEEKEINEEVDKNNNYTEKIIIPPLYAKKVQTTTITATHTPSPSPPLTQQLATAASKNNGNVYEESQVLLVGDLVWSKIPGHCWWPSMISYDPCDAIYFTKSKNGKDAVKYHVQFFGDKSLRGWVSKSNVINFQGT